MKKLKLDLDEMTVESFSTTPESGGKGTVQGYITNWSECGGAYCSLGGCDTTFNPYCDTAAVTCEYGPTMNPLDVECIDATMAGYTCDGGDTCAATCGQ
jgi:hypothetical protein